MFRLEIVKARLHLFMYFHTSHGEANFNPIYILRAQTIQTRICCLVSYEHLICETIKRKPDQGVVPCGGGKLIQKAPRVPSKIQWFG